MTNGLYTNFRWGFTGELQSMLVENGRGVWRDSRPTIHNPQSTIDLKGQWLMPAFIDNHCHILPTGLDLQKLHLGACDRHEAVLQAVRERLELTEPGKWLMAVHYDQTRYGGGEHLTRHDLDQISRTVPILLRHVNGHASVANTAALEAAGIKDSEPDPTGGTFRRDVSGAIDGVLLERAHERVTAAAPDLSLDEMVEAVMLAGEKMADLSIACASDMMTGRFDLAQEMEAYRIASERGCRIRVRLYVQWSAMFGPRAIDKCRFDELCRAMDPDRCRVAGVKIFADGAIGSATAAIYGSYAGDSEIQNPKSKIAGTLIYAPDKLKKMVLTAHEAGYQLAIHSIGDHSTNLVMDAYEATGDAKRHRIEHAMILSDAQIDRMAKLGCYCTMQPEFLLRFEHSYKRQLGPERAAKLKRFRSVWDAGIPLSFSSDRPIVAGDPRDGIAAATHRTGTYDPAENLTTEEAWLAYTQRAAAANGDADLMGSLLPGQLADFQVLEQNPLKCADLSPH